AAIAAAAGIGVAHLCRLFRRFAGITPGAYRDRRRAALAEDLLADTDLGLGAIAERLGYADAFAFSRAFKRVTGQAPSHWRQRR
ncbi:MAG: helix-turn-helix transcriptional regulator, partial [Planctomycetota bacterium]